MPFELQLGYQFNYYIFFFTKNIHVIIEVNNMYGKIYTIQDPSRTYSLSTDENAAKRWNLVIKGWLRYRITTVTAVARMGHGCYRHQLANKLSTANTVLIGSIHILYNILSLFTRAFPSLIIAYATFKNALHLFYFNYHIILFIIHIYKTIHFFF